MLAFFLVWGMPWRPYRMDSKVRSLQPWEETNRGIGIWLLFKAVWLAFYIEWGQVHLAGPNCAPLGRKSVESLTLKFLWRSWRWRFRSIFGHPKHFVDSMLQSWSWPFSIISHNGGYWSVAVETGLGTPCIPSTSYYYWAGIHAVSHPCLYYPI